MDNEQKTKKGRTFRDRWSKEIETSGGFTEVPNLLLEHLRGLHITASEFLTLTAILSHKWTKEQPWPSNKTISIRTNCNPRTVRKHVESLEKKGILKRVPGIHLSNVYDLTALKLKLEEFAKSNPRSGQKGSPASPKSTGGEGSILTPKEDSVEEDSIIIPINNINNLEVSNDAIKSFKDIEDIQEVYEFYLKCFVKEELQCKLTDKRKATIQDRLNDCGKEMLMKAIDNTSLNEWYMGANEHSWQVDLDYIIKSYDQVEKMTNLIVSDRLKSNRKRREFFLNASFAAQENRS